MGHTIDISVEAITAKSPDEISALAREYFLPFKYSEQLSSTPGQLRFYKNKRGLGFNPLDWASRLTVEIGPASNEVSRVVVEAAIDTTGQTVFDKEAQKWWEFIMNFRRALTGEELTDLGLIQRQANKQVLMFFLKVILSCVLIGLIVLVVKIGLLSLFR